MRSRPGVSAVLFAILLAGTDARAQSAAVATQQDPAAARASSIVAALRVQWQQRLRTGQVPAEVVEPKATAASILTPTIDVTQAPGVPEMQLRLNAGTVGLASFQVALISPSGSHVINRFVEVPNYPSAPVNKVFKIQISENGSGLGLYAEPGAWTLFLVQLYANDGSVISYAANTLTPLFQGPSTVNVLNPGTPDTTPPEIGAGSILTPTVSLSSSAPVLAVKVPVRDDLSGVASGFLVFTGTGSQTARISASPVILSPAMSGSVTAAANLSYTNPPAGTYELTQATMCDAAGNCKQLSTPAEIAAHFSPSTFSVTN